jgi:hypothetical protein
MDQTERIEADIAALRRQLEALARARDDDANPLGSRQLKLGRWQAKVEQDLATLLDGLLDLERRLDQLGAPETPRPAGRPLAASETQVAEVRRLRANGASLRAVARSSGLGLKTVRTILARESPGHIQ